jgi:hypothetical protein
VHLFIYYYYFIIYYLLLLHLIIELYYYYFVWDVNVKVKPSLVAAALVPKYRLLGPGKKHEKEKENASFVKAKSREK